MKYTYFISYKYHRIRDEIDEMTKEKKTIHWDSSSNDAFTFDFQLLTLEDIRKAELEVYTLLKKECLVINQEVVNLLITGIFPLGEKNG